MRKNLKSKILLTLLAASVFYLPAYAHAESLEITDATQKENITDGWLHESGDNYYTYIHISPPANSSISGNKIAISGVPKFLNDANYTYFNGAYADLDNTTGSTTLTGSTVSISSGSFNNKNQTAFRGAYADLTDVTNGSQAILDSNKVDIQSGTFSSNLTSIIGARADYRYGGPNGIDFNASASLQNNSVAISGSSFNNSNGNSDISGAYTDFYNLYPTKDLNAAVLTGNNVTIDSSSFNRQLRYHQ